MKQITLLALFVFIFWLFYSANNQVSEEAIDMKVESISYSTCDPTKKNCSFKDEQSRFILQFSRLPSALTPFSAIIIAKDIQPEAIDLIFNMNNMEMGFNRFQLKKNDNNWQTKIILPVCALGRNDWQLKVELSYSDRVKTTVFNFSQLKH